MKQPAEREQCLVRSPSVQCRWPSLRIPKSYERESSKQGRLHTAPAASGVARPVVRLE
jgi:hypothetical protein